MELRVDDHYDTDVATLHATVTSADYLTAKYAALGYTNVTVRAAGPRRVETQRDVSAPLPGFAKKVLGETTTVVQTEEYAEPAGDRVEGTWKAVGKGSPVTMGGTMTIEPDGDGCVLRIRGTVKAGIPLIGGKLEGFVGGEAQRTLADEYAFTRRWLAEH